MKKIFKFTGPVYENDDKLINASEVGVTVTSDDNGNVELQKINNIFVNPASSDGDGGTSGSSLPNVTNEDNGKTLKVDNGKWIVAKQSYTDLVDTPTLGALATKDSLNAAEINDLEEFILNHTPALGALATKDSLNAAEINDLEEFIDSHKPTYGASEVGAPTVEEMNSAINNAVNTAVGDIYSILVTINGEDA